MSIVDTTPKMMRQEIHDQFPYVYKLFLDKNYSACKNELVRYIKDEILVEEMVEFMRSE